MCTTKTMADRSVLHVYLTDLGYVTMYHLLAMNTILVMGIHIHVVCTE